MAPGDHLFDQLRQAGRSIMEGHQEERERSAEPVAEKPERRDLEDLLFDLIREANDRMMESKQRKLKELGITGLSMDMFRYVDVIGSLKNPNASAIAKALDLTRPSVTAILNKLERKHILQKRKDRTDGRAVRIELTDLGRSIASAYQAAHREMPGR